MKNYWLIKSEPNDYSWDNMKSEGVTHWDGVRNFQARNNMMKMKNGDLIFFYHSGSERQIVGVVKVVKEYYPDHTDNSGKFGMVDVAYSEDINPPITLKAIKQQSKLSEIALVKQSRLSVILLSKEEWCTILDTSART